MALAYSYIRWSSAKQTAGGSDARQTALAAEYIQKNNLKPADVSYKDVGISAAKLKNATEGALSLFLKACDEGKIPPGSHLLVETFDRLSRAEPLDALALFQKIVGYGITVVTLDDQMVYTTASINKNWTSLIIALAKMAGAHDENKKRGSRVQARWDGKRADQHYLTTVGPAWLKLTGKAPLPKENETRVWVELPDKVAVVQKVFELAIKGEGAPAISKILNDANVPTMTHKSKFWTQGVVMAMLKNEAVYGVYQRRGGTERLDDYYKPILTKADFAKAQTSIETRNHKGSGVRGGRVNNIFSGLLYCACSSKMRFVNGNPRYLYMRCIRAYENAGCDAEAHPYTAFESNVLELLTLVFSEALDAKTQIQTDPIAPIRFELSKKEQALKNLYDLVEEGTPLAGAGKRIEKIEAEIEELKHRLTHTHAPAPISATAEHAFELLLKHEELKDTLDGTDPVLKAFRLELKTGLAQLISKFVFEKTHRTVQLDPKMQKVLGRKSRVLGQYTIQGEFVQNLKKELEKTGGVTRALGTWSAEDLGINADGLTTEFEMLDWPSRAKVQRKRRAKPKGVPKVKGGLEELNWPPRVAVRRV